MIPPRSLFVFRFAVLAAILMLALGFAGAARSEDAPIALVLSNHRFDPSEIIVPAGQPILLHIENRDDTAEEFESPALKVEKVIAAGRKGIVHIRPLDPGRYPFMGEYHADTATGTIIAR